MSDEPESTESASYVAEHGSEGHTIHENVDDDEEMQVGEDAVAPLSGSEG